MYHTSSLFLLLVVLSLLLLLLPGTVTASRKPPTFVFDYAKPPAQRWDGALELAIRNKSWDDTFGTIFAFHNKTLFDSVTPDMYQRITKALQKNFPEQAEELKGIVQQFHQVFPDQVVSYEYLAVWIYYHEIAHAEFSSNNKKKDGGNGKMCTGLLAADSTGFVHHVANMDQSPPNVREVTLHVQYIDSRLDPGSQLLFQGVDWYWFNTGTTRMVMKGVASLQENWRTDHVVGNIPIEDVLQDIDNGVQSQVLVFRYALEQVVKQRNSNSSTTTGFEELLEHMRTVRLAAPEYIVMAGPENMQGAVLARNQTGIAAPGGKVLHLGETDGNPSSAQMAPEITKWALAQTNYEHWQEDNPADPRRTVAEQTMANFGQDIAATYSGLYAVASTYPVHATSTAYTAVMNAKTGDLQPFVRTMMCPVGDDDCLKNAEAHGLGFGASSSSSANEATTKHLRGSSTNPTMHTIIAILAVALALVLGLLLLSKADLRSQYKPVPNAANGTH